MSVKGSQWTEEKVKQLEEVMERASRWHAEFRHEDDAVIYAWTHPGFMIAPSVQMPGIQRWSVYRLREKHECR